jgi:ABC-type branched-subunit amino acid transport system ATPase component
VGLEACGVTVRFGGVVALDRVDLVAPMGEVTGLVGPNGAGKTTLFNVCCGIVHPAEGRVLLHGVDLSRRTVAARARRGLGRTFQRPELFTSLTAGDAVALGREASLAGMRPWNHLLGRAAADAPGAEWFTEALELSGVASFAGVNVAELSTAQRRLVELGRCLSARFDVLLLDEPTAGLDGDESRAFSATLRRVVAARGIGVLVVEHDMSVVLDLCDRVTVLDFGTVLFEGTPREMMATEAVRAAYLGSWEPSAGAPSA